MRTLRRESVLKLKELEKMLLKVNNRLNKLVTRRAQIENYIKNLEQLTGGQNAVHKG